MPFIDPELGHLTVINLFKTDAPERVDTLVREMRSIVDTADFPGWISSTVHRGQQKMGTANFIQWRGKQDLESRYDGAEFKHRTVPVFHEITTFIRLMQTEVEIAQRHPALGDATELSPDRDDYTVIEVLGVAPGDQKSLIETVGAAHSWLVDVPGYRSQSVLRGVRSRGTEDGSLTAFGKDNDFVVVYSQWDGREAFEAYRNLPEAEQSAARRAGRAKRDALITAADWNSYRVVHTRSAPQPVTA
ncbi:antibiotic biosynthesis monooxygenase family protein [Streptomyces xiamenensis]|uniref:Oxidase-like protein n=1 Tax=Streptomyces xiamenensis TaxID=408015 RepID=A0A0F7CPN9_9ACTN|nr:MULTISPECIES: antibiotic biosynthesis monooxygenase [Streptomyces]AKG44991.1 oxidase-like protein [Streptomyces xiamenensis]MCU4746980.1 antibiotic biosynthesis monooxygenase [Streptomyces sp. G-5]QQN77664.1 antibiotic biosynthesis monooxygenase [Streptomyces sp. XC 2026]